LPLININSASLLLAFTSGYFFFLSDYYAGLFLAALFFAGLASFASIVVLFSKNAPKSSSSFSFFLFFFCLRVSLSSALIAGDALLELKYRLYT